MDAIARLASIFRLSQLLSFFPFSLEKSNGTNVLRCSEKYCCRTVVTVLVLVLAQVYVVVYEVQESANLAPQTSSGVVLELSNLSLILSGFMLLLPVLRRRETLCYWLNRIRGLFSHLKDDRLSNVVAVYCWVIAAIALFIPSVVGVEFYFYVFNSQYSYKESILFRPEFVILCYHFIVFQLKMFVQLFFVFVNLIRYYYEEAREALTSRGKTWNRESSLSYLQDFRLRDLEVKDLVEFLHSFFIPVVSLQMLWAWFIFLYNVCVTTKGSDVPVYLHLMWTAYTFWDVFLVVTLCHLAENEGDRTVHCLHEWFIRWNDSEFRTEIVILSLQLQHRRLEFVVLGCNKLNFSLLYWMVGMLASYAVIMAQLHSDADGGNCCRNSSGD